MCSFFGFPRAINTRNSGLGCFCSTGLCVAKVQNSAQHTMITSVRPPFPLLFFLSPFHTYVAQSNPYKGTLAIFHLQCHQRRQGILCTFTPA